MVSVNPAHSATDKSIINMTFKDTWGNRVKWTIVKSKVRIQRGQNWLSYANPFIYLGVLKSVLENPYIVIVYIPIYTITAYIIGYSDERWGIWKLEALYGSRELNPLLEQMQKDVKYIKKQIDILLGR